MDMRLKSMDVAMACLPVCALTIWATYRYIHTDARAA